MKSKNKNITTDLDTSYFIKRDYLQRKYHVIIVLVESRKYWYIENCNCCQGTNEINFQNLDEVETFLKNMGRKKCWKK